MEGDTCTAKFFSLMATQLAVYRRVDGTAGACLWQPVGGVAPILPGRRARVDSCAGCGLSDAIASVSMDVSACLTYIFSHCSLYNTQRSSSPYTMRERLQSFSRFCLSRHALSVYLFVGVVTLLALCTAVPGTFALLTVSK